MAERESSTAVYPSDRWRRLLALGWPIWVATSLVFASLVGLLSLVPINCSPPALSGSPGGNARLSLWPFGPGCEFFGWTSDPGWGWTAVLVMLAAAGVLLGVSQRRYTTALMQRPAASTTP